MWCPSTLDPMFLPAEAFLPSMRKLRWGRIVAISSAMLHVGSSGVLHDVASKGAIIGFIRSLAGEIGPYGVTINGIPPASPVPMARVRASTTR